MPNGDGQHAAVGGKLLTFAVAPCEAQGCVGIDGDGELVADGLGRGQRHLVGMQTERAGRPERCGKKQGNGSHGIKVLVVSCERRDIPGKDIEK